MKILNTILSIVFPRYCMSCKKENADLCFDCILHTPFTERHCLPWIFPIYDYQDSTIRKSIWLLKYKGKKTIAKVFAQSIYDRILEELYDLFVFYNFSNPIIIPIPTTKNRIKKRGYNQAEILAKEIVKIMENKEIGGIEGIEGIEGIGRIGEIEGIGRIGGIGGIGGIEKNSLNFMNANTDTLIRIKDTGTQAKTKGKKCREQNMLGVFEIKNKKNIYRRNIILIDDVITTGATLSEARKTLLDAGARKVVAFTIAH